MSGADVVIKAGAVVEQALTVLQGSIIIEKGTVVHPNAKILAEGGPIHIGCNNLIEEGVVIVNRSTEGETMTIGDLNVFEVFSRSEAMSIGNNNTIQMRAVLGSKVKLNNGCTVGVSVNLSSDQTIPDHTEIHKIGESLMYRAGRDRPQLLEQQLDYLRNLIPNYHKIRKSTKPVT